MRSRLKKLAVLSASLLVLICAMPPYFEHCPGSKEFKGFYWWGSAPSAHQDPIWDAGMNCWAVEVDYVMLAQEVGALLLASAMGLLLLCKLARSAAT